MVQIAFFLTNAILAAVALARPSLKDRVNARAEGTRHISGPLIPVDGAEPLVGGGNVSHVEYSQNWAGAVYNSAAGTYKSVTAKFIVPTPKKPSGGSSSKSYSASAWVGIDGDSCSNAILQTGVDFTVQGGSVSYDAWYEWYPDYAYDFSGISFSPGDEVELTVTAKTTKSGTAVIQNLSTGKKVSKSITSSSALCEQDAEWIVEDFEQGSSLVPLVNFGSVTFTSASAGTASGSVGPSGANLIDIKQSSTVYTDSSVGSSTVTVKYV